MNDFVNFFKDLDFDTWIALISCLCGIISLFVSRNAYKKCQLIEKSFNDKNTFNDASMDLSQKAGKNIINNGYDANSLIAVTQALANINEKSFAIALENAYKQFNRQSEENLQHIIKETHNIIRSKKLELSSYNKIDWINIYFESAKNSSDSFMQKIWAGVLAQELSCPDSFSFKTLDILKNMSANDFKMFQSLCAIQIDGFVLRDALNLTNELNWDQYLTLEELGLINLKETERTGRIEGGEKSFFVCGKEYLILLKNEHNLVKEIKLKIYCLTSAARELLVLVNLQYSLSYAIDLAKSIQKKLPAEIRVTLHKIEDFDLKEIGYDDYDLLIETEVSES